MDLDLSARFRDVMTRIRVIPVQAPVTLIAVSKTQSVEAIEALYHLGQRDFGENYVQELVEKAPTLEAMGCTGIRWHMIGHLQSNKVKQLVPFVTAVHSIASEKLAVELNKRWADAGRPGKLQTFIEVNIDQESSKSGALPQDVLALSRFVAALPGLALQGLMTIPSPEKSASGEAFRKLRELELTSRPATQGALSMGMTQDFETAIQQGATHVRVGTALFGKRPTKG